MDVDPLLLVHLALFDINSPVFPDEWGASATDAGPEVRWFWGDGGTLQYGSGGTIIDTNQTFSGLHDVTINYDLQEDTYDV